MNKETPKNVDIDFFGEGGLEGKKKSAEAKVESVNKTPASKEEKYASGEKTTAEAKMIVDAKLLAGMDSETYGQDLEKRLSTQETIIEEAADGSRALTEAVRLADIFRAELAYLATVDKKSIEEPADGSTQKKAAAEIKKMFDSGKDPKKYAETLQENLQRLELKIKETVDPQLEAISFSAAVQMMKENRAQLELLETMRRNMARIEKMKTEAQKTVEATLFVGTDPKEYMERLQDQIQRLGKTIEEGKANGMQLSEMVHDVEQRYANLAYLKSIINKPEELGRIKGALQMDAAESYALPRLENEAVVVNMDAAAAKDLLDEEPETVEQPMVAKKTKVGRASYSEPKVSGGLNLEVAQPIRLPPTAERPRAETYNLKDFVADGARQVGGWFKGLFASSPTVDKGRVFASTEDIAKTQSKQRTIRERISYDKSILNQNVRNVAEAKNRVESAIIRDKEILKYKTALQEPDLQKRTIDLLNRKIAERAKQIQQEVSEGQDKTAERILQERARNLAQQERIDKAG